MTGHNQWKDGIFCCFHLIKQNTTINKRELNKSLRRTWAVFVRVIFLDYWNFFFNRFKAPITVRTVFIFFPFPSPCLCIYLAFTKTIVEMFLSLGGLMSTSLQALSILSLIMSGWFACIVPTVLIEKYYY